MSFVLFSQQQYLYFTIKPKFEFKGKIMCTTQFILLFSKTFSLLFGSKYLY